MSDSLIQYTQNDNGVLLLTLNRPQVLNALSTRLMETLIDSLDRAESDANVRVVVITGAGKAFAAGGDIAEMQKKAPQDKMREDIFGRLTRRFDGFKLPVIAAVNGYALGGGCELAMMCDFIIASDTAQFGQPEIKLGTLPGFGGTQRLTKLVGKSKAMELCLTGRRINAQEAEKIGLVARILPEDGFLPAVLEIAAGIAGHSKVATAMVKQAVNAAENMSLQDGLAFERNLFYLSFFTDDRLEGMRAFVEKRPPNFTDS